jgi:hypothetical protein
VTLVSCTFVGCTLATVSCISLGGTLAAVSCIARQLDEIDARTPIQRDEPQNATPWITRQHLPATAQDIDHAALNLANGKLFTRPVERCGILDTIRRRSTNSCARPPRSASDSSRP